MGMDVRKQNLSLRMVRDHLDSIPEYPLPSGFVMRNYRPGDRELWVQIVGDADEYIQVTPELFDKVFGPDHALLAERQFFLVAPDDRAIGTITAWVGPQPEWGRIHWVAIVPEWQGRGLAKPMMSVACRRLRELGHERAYLITSTARVPALNLYLKFGFYPDPRDEREREAWLALTPYLKLPLKGL